MNKKTSDEILNKLCFIFPNPKSELIYHNVFELLCAVILSAQTTDQRVNLVTKELFAKYPTSLDMQSATFNDVFPIIKTVGLAKTKTINLLSMSRIIQEKYDGQVPCDMNALLSLPGVGKKTASVVQAVGFGIPAMPVDTHLYRMAIRLGYIKKGQKIDDAIKAYCKYIPKDKWIDAHHLLLLFGRYYCKALKPECNQCVLLKYCKN